MNAYPFTFCGAALVALGSGALHWPARGLLCVSDLHLCKAERMARRGGPALPPYETQETLTRLEADIEATGAACVVCLGDSFDDLAAAESLGEAERLRLARLQAGRRWVWIEGNHDPGPLDLGGSHLQELVEGPLTFRHIAAKDAGAGEVSGHYHPKARLAAVRRPAFLLDGRRLILPAFGTYTGGLRCNEPALRALMQEDAVAILTGRRPVAVPMRAAG